MEGNLEALEWEWFSKAGEPPVVVPVYCKNAVQRFLSSPPLTRNLHSYHTKERILGFGSNARIDYEDIRYRPTCRSASPSIARDEDTNPRDSRQAEQFWGKEKKRVELRGLSRFRL